MKHCFICPSFLVNHGKMMDVVLLLRESFCTSTSTLGGDKYIVQKVQNYTRRHQSPQNTNTLCDFDEGLFLQCSTSLGKVWYHISPTPKLSSWWFQPIWKYESKWIISPSRGENKNIWNHHPVLLILWGQPPYTPSLSGEARRCVRKFLAETTTERCIPESCYRIWKMK